MSNPFKKGDRVKAKESLSGVHAPVNTVFTVEEVKGHLLVLTPRVGQSGEWHYTNVRAAVPGVDYNIVDNGPLEYSPNTGHLSDGSSVQKHSAGPLYPCIVAMRDGKLGGKFDYGVLSPRNQEPLWLANHEAAVALALIIKKDLTCARTS